MPRNYGALRLNRAHRQYGVRKPAGPLGCAIAWVVATAVLSVAVAGLVANCGGETKTYQTCHDGGRICASPTQITHPGP